MKVKKPKVFNYQNYVDAVEENKVLKEDMDKIVKGVKELQKKIVDLEIENRILIERLSKYE